MVQEIKAFRLTHQEQDLNERVLTLMDKQISYHILFLVKWPTTPGSM